MRLRPHGAGVSLTSNEKARKWEVISTVGASSPLADGMITIVNLRLWKGGRRIGLNLHFYILSINRATPQIRFVKHPPPITRICSSGFFFSFFNMRDLVCISRNRSDASLRAMGTPKFLQLSAPCWGLLSGAVISFSNSFNNEAAFVQKGEKPL